MATTDHVRRAMALSRADAVLFALMVGLGEAYFVADGVRLGADAVELGLLVGLPLFVGAIGPLVTVSLLERWRRRKPIVLVGVAGQVVLLAGLAVLELFQKMQPGILIAMASSYQVFGQAAGVAWSSWYGDVVPVRLRGRYFASRNAWAHAATCIALVIAGFLLQWLEPRGSAVAHVLTETNSGGLGLLAERDGLGYTAVFALAGLARMISFVFLALSPESPCEGVVPLRAMVETLSSGGGRAMRRLLLAVGTMQFAVYIGAAYFTPFMLTELQFSYTAYTIASVAVVVVKSAAMRSWGQRIDRQGPRHVFLRTGVVIALLPLPWACAHGFGMVVAIQMLAGFAWGGYEVSQFSLLLQAADARLRPPLLATTNTVTGLAQLLGSVAGSVVAHFGGGGYRIVFVATCAARLLAALFVAPLVSKERLSAKDRPQVLFRILGVRPGGGLGHRPLMVDASEPSGDHVDVDVDAR